MTKTIKVLVDASSLVHNKTGVGYFAERLIESLANESSQSVSITAYYFNFLGRKKSLDLPVNPRINYKVIKFFPSKLLSFSRRLGFQIPVEFFVGFNRYDFIIYPNFVALPQIRKTPYAVAVHDLSFLDHPEYMQEQNRRFLQRFVEHSVAKSAFVITISNFTKARIAHHFGNKAARKTITIPIPHEEKKATGHVREHFHKIIKNRFILYIGTVEPRKNIVNLVQGFKKTPSAIDQSVQLVIAGGSGWKNENIYEEIDASSKNVQINLTGYVNDAERDLLYKHTSVVCLLSHYEGFGMPILEAMHYRKPLLLSSIPVFHEVAGKYATYCDGSDPIDVAKKLERILSRHDTIDRHSIPNYSWDNNAKQLIQVITSKVERFK